MGLLDNLGLKPKPASAKAAPDPAMAQAETLKSQLGKDIKDAVALANTLPDPKAKLALAKALQDADRERKNAESERDAGKRAQALQATREKVSAAAAEAKQAKSAQAKLPQGADAGDGPVSQGVGSGPIADGSTTAQPPVGRSTGVPEAPKGVPVSAQDGKAKADAKPADAKSVDAKSDAQGADAKAEATKLAPAIAKQQADAKAAYDKLRPEQNRLEDEIEKAKADKSRKAEVADLEAKKKAINVQMAPVQDKLKQLDADAKALDDPRSTTKTYNDILARQQSGATVVPEVKIDKHDSELEKKRTENKTTTVKTGYDDGKSTTQTDVSKTTVGKDGYTQDNSKTKEVVKSDGSKTTDSEKRVSTVGKDGLGYDKTVKSEQEDKDGKKSGTEDKTSVKVGPGGATRTDSSTKTNADGSGTTTSKTAGVERGDGKIARVTNSSDSKTDASGNTTTTGSKTKTGVIAGKDGMGGFADTEGSYDKKNANGMKTGAVAGLNANIVCNVVAKGGEPPTYDLSVSINLGMKVGLSAGREKEGADGSSSNASVSVSGSEAVFMNRHYVLGEAEAQAYVAALKSGSGTQQEFAVIRTGLSKGWDAAREMYLAMTGHAVDKKEVAKLKEGESIEVGKKEKAGANVSAGGKGGVIGGGVEGGYEVTHDQSMKVTKEKDGKLTYDTKEGDADKLSGGAKVNVGVVEGGANFSHTNTTSTGYKVSVDPKDPKAGEMQDALARCKSQKDLDAFAAKYPQSVQEKTKSTGTADTQGVTVGVGPVKAGLNYGNSVDEAVTTDKDGKFKKKVTTGGNTGGAELGIGKYKVGASTKEQAVAEVDADGNASLDVTKADKSTDAAKWLESNVPGAGDKKDKKDGALTKAAGGGEEPDTDAKDLKGIKLKGSDLGYLGHLACNDWGKWMSACPSPSMRDDWAKAGKAIKGRGGDKGAVAQELAKFVGADSGSRANVVNAIVRPAGDVSGGSRYEFPGSLASQKGTYDALVNDDAEKQLDGLKDDKAKLESAAAALLSQLDRLYAQVSSATGFEQPAVQAEMLAAINNRKGKIEAKMRVLKGGKADELSKDEKLKKYNDYIDNCTRFKNTENDCFGKIEATYKDGKPGLDQVIENAKLIKQVRDLHALWQPQYDEMAALAQENGFGKDTYWKYKPDRERFNRAAQSGNPGAATEAKPETEDKRKKAPPPVAPKDPVGDANRELEKKRAETTQGIEAQLPAAKNKAYGAGNRLFAWVQTDKRPAAGDAHNRGMVLLKRADSNAAKVKKGNVQDLESYGFIAIEDYNAATKAFGEGLAFYPAGMPKKEKKEAST